MATCGSLHQIFELNTPLSTNPSSLIDSLSSWKQIKPSIPSHSFTEIFGELHFQENTQPTSSSSSSSSSSPINPFFRPDSGSGSGTYHERSESFSSMNSESLQLCTEGLGFESMDNIDDLKINDNNNNDDCNIKQVNSSKHSNYEYKNGKLINERCFPPPISCIGKPWVSFRSYREEGRFILKEIRMPAQEILQACRKDGRLRLCFVHPKDDEDDDNDEDDDEYEEETEEYDEKIAEDEEKIRDEFDRDSDDATVDNDGPPLLLDMLRQKEGEKKRLFCS